MQIELRNIQVNERLSDDSNAFSATIYIDNKKVGIATDDGRGGETDYYASNAQGKELLREAETWCKALPPSVRADILVDGKPLTVDMNLSLYLANIVFEHLQKKEAERLERKIQKLMVDSIVYGSIPKDVSYLKYKIPIADFLKSEAGMKALKKAIVERVIPELKGGQKILNTNFSDDFIRTLGLDSTLLSEKKVLDGKDRSIAQENDDLDQYRKRPR